MQPWCFHIAWCVSPWRSRMLWMICNLSYRLNYLRKDFSAWRTLLASLKIWSYSWGDLVLTANLHGCLLRKTKEMFSSAFPEWQHGSWGDWSSQTLTCRGDHSKPGTEFCMVIAQCTCDSRAGSGLFFLCIILYNLPESQQAAKSQAFQVYLPLKYLLDV